jgi:hypothetical protein
MWAFSAILSTFNLSLPATNSLHSRQYDDIRGGIPRTGMRSKRGLGDFADIEVSERMVPILTQVGLKTLRISNLSKVIFSTDNQLPFMHPTQNAPAYDSYSRT